MKPALLLAALLLLLVWTRRRAVTETYAEVQFVS